MTCHPLQPPQMRSYDPGAELPSAGPCATGPYLGSWVDLERVESRTRRRPAGAAQLTRGGWRFGYSNRSGIASAPWTCACQAALPKGPGRAAVRDQMMWEGRMRTCNPCRAMDRDARLSASHATARVRGSRLMFRRRLFQTERRRTAGFRSENASFFPLGSHALLECADPSGSSIRFRFKRGRVGVAA